MQIHLKSPVSEWTKALVGVDAISEYFIRHSRLQGMDIKEEDIVLYVGRPYQNMLARQYLQRFGSMLTLRVLRSNDLLFQFSKIHSKYCSNKLRKIIVKGVSH